MNNLEYIKKRVEQETGLDNLEAKGRQRERVIARCIYTVLAKKFTSSSLMQIGKNINRNYATIIYYAENLEMHLMYEIEFSKMFDSLQSEFKEGNLKGNDNNRKKIIQWVNNLPERKYEKVLAQLETMEI